jgi:hypothetical protein
MPYLVYKGEEPYADFVRLQAQGVLFVAPTRDPVMVKAKLEALAARVVEDLGREASWADLKDTLKSRAAGKVVYDSSLAVAALESALRQRGESIK